MVEVGGLSRDGMGRNLLAWAAIAASIVIGVPVWLAGSMVLYVGVLAEDMHVILAGLAGWAVGVGLPVGVIAMVRR